MTKLKDIIDILHGNPIILSVNIGGEEFEERIFARADAVKYHDCVVRGIFATDGDFIDEHCLYLEIDARGVI